MFISILRRLARLPLVNLFATKLEDYVDLARLAGTSNRRQITRNKLASITTIDDWLSFIRPLLPPTQINSEISGLISLATERKVRRVLEIGTAQGGTTFLLARGIPTTDWILTVDLLPRHKHVLSFLSGASCIFHALRGSSREDSTFTRIASLVGKEPVDLLFIDGDHSYEGVRDDYNRYSPLVKAGGLIVFHDIASISQSNTGQPNTGQRWVGGVPIFWQEVKTLGVRSWEFVEDWNQQGFGIGVIETPSKNTQELNKSTSN